jgi:hypothetical protein
MEEQRREEQASGGTGRYRCYPWQTDHLPGNDKPIRRLLKALEQELEEYADKPTDATKKFGDDLKEFDKEYQGIADVAGKYETFYAKLECRLAEAHTWKEQIENWCSEKVDENTRRAIRTLREDDYDAKDREFFCQWLAFRARLIRLSDCLGQALKKEEEARDDYGAVKGFEKTLSDRFAELKSLFDKAKGFQDNEKFKSVCAVGSEYAEVYDNLSTVRTWEYLKNLCDGDQSSDEEARLVWPPDKFRTELTNALRALILAAYQRFRWHQQRMETESDTKKFKEASDKFRKGRRDEFIQEAEDITARQGADRPGAARPGAARPDEPEL